MIKKLWIAWSRIESRINIVIILSLKDEKPRVYWHEYREIEE